MRRTRIRRQRPPTQWFVPVWDGNVGTTVTPGVLSTTALLDTTETGVTATGPFVERMTLVRIRGQLVFGNGDATHDFNWMAGIIALDETGGGGGLALDPTVQADAAKSWLWLRSGHCNATPATPTTAEATNVTDGHVGCEVDIKVKRIIRPGMRVQLAVKAAGGGAASSVVFRRNLRLLLERIA